MIANLRGQLRVSPMGGVIGFDFVAAFEMGRGMGIEPYLLTEFLPEIEAAAVVAINEKLKETNG